MMALSLASITKRITASSDEILKLNSSNLGGNEASFTRAAHDLLTALVDLCCLLMAEKGPVVDKGVGQRIIPCLKRQHKASMSDSNSNAFLPWPASLLTAMELVYSLDDEKVIQEVLSMFRGPISKLIAPTLANPSLVLERSIASHHQAAYSALAPYSRSWMWSLIEMAIRFYEGTGISCLSPSFLSEDLDDQQPAMPEPSPSLILISLFSHIILGLSQDNEDKSFLISAQNISYSVMSLSGILHSLELKQTAVSSFKSLILSLSVLSSHVKNNHQAKELSSSFVFIFKSLGGIWDALVHNICFVLQQALEKLGGPSDDVEVMGMILRVLGGIEDGSPASAALSQMCRESIGVKGKTQKEGHANLLKLAELMFAGDATVLARSLVVWLSPEADLPLDFRLSALSKLSSLASDLEHDINWSATNVYRALVFTLSHDSAVRMRRAAITLLIALPAMNDQGDQDLLVLCTILQKCRDKDEVVKTRAFAATLKSDPKLMKCLVEEKGEDLIVDLSIFFRGSLAFNKGQADKELLKTLLIELLDGNRALLRSLHLPLSIFSLFE